MKEYLRHLIQTNINTDDQHKFLLVLALSTIQVKDKNCNSQEFIITTLNNSKKWRGLEILTNRCENILAGKDKNIVQISKNNDEGWVSTYYEWVHKDENNKILSYNK